MSSNGYKCLQNVNTQQKHMVNVSIMVSTCLYSIHIIISLVPSSIHFIYMYLWTFVNNNNLIIYESTDAFRN